MSRARDLGLAACASPTATSRRCAASTSRSQAGEVFAFLGPNGAGKTTTVEILEGYRERSGRRGHGARRRPGARRPREWRERIGIVLQQCRMRPELTVRETLELYAGYYRAPLGVAETIEHVGLAREGRRARRAALRRPAAPPRRRRRADRRPRAALPRRADDRLRPLRPPPGLGRDRGPARARQDGLPDHPLHGRGPAARRPGGDHRRGRIVAEGRPDELGDRERRPATISFRLPDGIDARRAARPGSSVERAATASSTLDHRSARSRRSTGSPAGRWSARSSSTGSRSAARASRTSTSS